MSNSLSPYADPDRYRAAKRKRASLPSLPWVEVLGFLIMIAMTLPRH